MNTIEDIIEWIKNYENPSENIEKFAYELGEMIKDMDYTASNGGAAVGYAGATGSYKGVNTGIYLTVDNLTAGSNGEYSFVNNGVNILNNDEFKDILFDAVGEDADRIMGGNWDDGTRSKYSFGDAVALNDIVSENFMSTNARGDVILLIEESATANSVLAMTEIPCMLDNPKVTHILGIEKENFEGLTYEEVFEVLKEKSLAMQSEATIYRGTMLNADGDEVTVELLSLENTQYADVFKVNIPDGFVAVGTYYDRLQGMGVNLLTDEQIIDKYSFLGGADNEIMNTVRIAEYRGDSSKLRLAFDNEGKLASAEICDYPVSVTGGDVTGFTICQTSVGDLSRTTVDFGAYIDGGHRLTSLEKFYVLELNNEITAANSYIKLIEGKAGAFEITGGYNEISAIVGRTSNLIDFITSNGNSIILTNEQAVYITVFEGLREFKAIWEELPSDIKDNKELWKGLINKYFETPIGPESSVPELSEGFESLITAAENLQTYANVMTKIGKITETGLSMLVALDFVVSTYNTAILIEDGCYEEAGDYLVDKLETYAGYVAVGGILTSFVQSSFVSTFTYALAATGIPGMIAAAIITYAVPFLGTYILGDAFGELIDVIVLKPMEFISDVTEAVVDGVCDFVDMIGDWWSSLWGSAKTVKVDPLIIDLDGDGYNILTKDKGVNFDLDNNGFAEKINWTEKDGILALDLNENGLIDNGGELFGDKTLLANGEYALNGFEALAEYDTNNDGIIDENDEIFDSLLVWIDGNGNGVSEEGELKHLRELGIKAIELNYESVDIDANNEASISHSARVIYEDGNDTTVGELWVSSDKFNTVDNIELEISDEIKALPNISGSGNIMSLRNAMQLDTTGTIKDLVKRFISSGDKSERGKLVDELLINLVGANDIKPDSRGGYFDGQKLAVLESFFGEEFVGYNGKNPNSLAAQKLELLYENIAERYYYELLAKGTAISSYIGLIEYRDDSSAGEYDTSTLCKYLQFALHANIADENIIADISGYLSYAAKSSGRGDLYSGFRNFIIENMPDYIPIMENNIAGHTITGNEDEKFTGSITNDFIIGGGGNDTINGGRGNDVIYGGIGDDEINGGNGNDVIYGEVGNDTINGEAGNDTIYGGIGNDTINGGSGNDIIYGEDENDTLNGEGGNDTLVGGRGNDRLNGGAGNDTYVIGLGDGNDTIYDNGGSNIIRFTDGIKPEDLIATYGDGNSITLTNRNTGDSIEIVSFRYSATYRNFVMVFDDGTEMKFDDERSPLRNLEGTDGDDTLSAFYSGIKYHAGEGNDTINGSSGEDEMYGEDGDDKIYGNEGDDILIGGRGNDYLAGGAGNDTYVIGLGDGNDTIYDNGGRNIIRFKDGIKPEDLIATYGDGNSITLTNRNTGDSIEIVSFRYSATYRNFVMVFDDGTEMKFDDERSPLRNLEGTDGDDTLSPFYSGIKYHAGAGNDTINGSSGEDEIYGEDGDDKIYGDAGNDVIYGGAGNDTINGDDGNDYIYGEDGNDTINGGAGNDVIYGGTGDDTIYGSSGADEMYGEDGDDTLNGDSGNDILVGGKGNDKLNGGEGNDTYVIGLGDGNDIISDKSGSNII
ncbi:MAG: calcium-binding protein, partial [Lachnospiraceae bacterium]|nr:calcium-binding protein [Lachnospiraceae bacterium]